MKFLLKALTVISIALSLAACDNMYMYPGDLDQAKEICSINSGVEKYYFEQYGDGNDLTSVTVYCKNGVKYSYKPGDLNK